MPTTIMVVAVSRPSISFSQNSAQRETGWPAADQLGSNRAVGKTEPLGKRVRPAETLFAHAPLYNTPASQSFSCQHYPPIFAEVRDLVRQPELLRRLNLQEVSCESNSHQNIPLPVEPTMGTASSAQSGGRN